MYLDVWYTKLHKTLHKYSLFVNLRSLNITYLHAADT